MEFYRNLAHTSDYIRHLLVEKNESVWIAQRNGRTKDGRDVTDPAVIKMLGMSRRDDRVASLAELHIVPVSVSYEWESCDILKTKELYISRNQKYEKKPGEDLNSILTGVMQPKGKVTIHFGKVLSEADFEELKDCPSGVFYKKVAEKMGRLAGDHQILCITHLPQIAAMEDSHFLIAKESSGGRTVTHISRLSETESDGELARLLGGAAVTEAVLENAREMKRMAAASRGGE